MRKGICLFFALLGTQAYADCGAARPVLSCDIGTKHLEVCVGPSGATYAYGPKSGPEIELSHTFEALLATPWAGVGRTIFEDITFRNGEVSYTVWMSLDRLAAAERMNGGVSVSRNGIPLVDLECKKGSAQITTFTISDGFQAAGFCWNRASARWQRCE